MTRHRTRSAAGEAPAVTPVVVAGGRSRRFGDADKLVAEVDGRPLVDRAATAADRAMGRAPIVAARDADHACRIAAAVTTTDPTLVTDDPDFEGPVAGIAAALEAVDTPWVFVCGGDMPWLDPDAVRTVVSRATVGEPAGVVPVDDGRPEPLHGAYRAADLEGALADACSRTGVRGVVERLTPLVALPVTHADESLRRSLADVDERADLPNQTTEPTLTP